MSIDVANLIVFVVGEFNWIENNATVEGELRHPQWGVHVNIVFILFEVIKQNGIFKNCLYLEI